MGTKIGGAVVDYSDPATGQLKAAIGALSTGDIVAVVGPKELRCRFPSWESTRMSRW